MGLAPMEGVLPGPRSEMAILLLFFDTGTLLYVVVSMACWMFIRPP